MRSISFIKPWLTAIVVLLAISFCFSAHTAVAQVSKWDAGIGGVLLVGKFRTQQQLNGMKADDERNTLITELDARTRDTGGFYQSLNDADLAGAGALLVYLRETGSRTDQQIKTLSADDMRNIVIVEVKEEGVCNVNLQALSNLNVVSFVLERPISCVRG